MNEKRYRERYEIQKSAQRSGHNHYIGAQIIAIAASAVTILPDGVQASIPVSGIANIIFITIAT
jgi:hypothetical protein